MLFIYIPLNGFNTLLAIIKLNNWSLVTERKLLNRFVIPYSICGYGYGYCRIVSNTDLKSDREKHWKINLDVSILQTDTNMDIYIINFSGYGLSDNSNIHFHFPSFIQAAMVGGRRSRFNPFREATAHAGSGAPRRALRRPSWGAGWLVLRRIPTVIKDPRQNLRRTMPRHAAATPVTHAGRRSGHEPNCPLACCEQARPHE